MRLNTPNTTPPRESFYSSDGIQLCYRVWTGAGKAHKPCLLLHGFTNQADIWQPLAEALQAKGFSVYALDFRGHGLSGWDPKRNYSHERLKQDVAEFLKHLELKSCHIIAHSLGARVASLLIAQLSRSGYDQVCSFCLADTGPDVRAAGVDKVRRDAEAMPQVFNKPDDYLRLLKRIYMLSEPSALEAMSHYSLHQQDGGQYRLRTDPEFTRYLWKPNTQNNNTKDLTAPLNQELWQALEKITVPCQLIRGQMSAILSTDTADKMLQTLTHAKLETIPMAGHALMLDNAAAFNKTVLEFVLDIERLQAQKG